MAQALKEAVKAREKDEVPVGAIVVRGGKIISRAHNLRESNNQASAHAELLALQKASKKLGTWCLDDCELYVTLEPCMMCIGAISLSRIKRLVYGATDPKGGATETLIDIKKIRHVGAYPKMIEKGVMAEECGAILTEFFREKRKKPKVKKDSPK